MQSKKMLGACLQKVRRGRRWRDHAFSRQRRLMAWTRWVATGRKKWLIPDEKGNVQNLMDCWMKAGEKAT